MTKLQSALVLLTLVSSSVVFANTDFKTLDAHEQALQSQDEVQTKQLMEQLNMQSHDGLTENDFFEY
ncbi:calmodulin [Pseudoalteromonas sp. MMG006]|uniref:calmodulin n=1 Tax=Pseudoalteromonas TaxID=53246 RepID=UPI001B36127A|nr:MULTISPECIES: calmodulin [unclassified Pseudoalteromonas]MBQ4798236.1 calmodulin [Pseudoalteromonas sp. MMG006]MBQ4857946.1 calmodulin [Pseudoalteromonas sp. MMG007]